MKNYDDLWAEQFAKEWEEACSRVKEKLPKPKAAEEEEEPNESPCGLLYGDEET